MKFLLPAMLSLLLTACASLPVSSFQSFHTSLKEAQTGLSAELERDAQWTREAEIQEVADDNAARLSAYMVRAATGTAWSMDRPPAYWQQRNTARVLGRVNRVFSEYAGLLADSVAGGRPGPQDFETLAARLNSGLRDLSDAAGWKRDDRAVAGGSSGLSELLRTYLERRRLADLRGALKENQPWVDAYAARCGDLVRLVRADLKAAYGDQMASLQSRWSDKRAPGRAGLTRSLFNLNEEYADAMEALAVLEEFYARLPAAHRELEETLGRQARGRKALSALSDAAARVASLTRRLEKDK